MIMEYEQKINLLDDTTNQPSKLKTRNCVEIKVCRIVQNDNIFKTFKIRSSLCHYSGGYILVKGTITVPNMVAVDKRQ